MSNPLVIDLSKTGAFFAFKKFMWSLVKSVLASTAAYLLLRLDNAHLADFVKPQFAALALTVIASLRALLSSVPVWLTTTAVSGPSDVIQ